ncbi:MAG: Response regulator [Symbiobacteriaceae bacterium]|jgi:putative nucleotidyltransferase with HDIG domain|nr:Response regulator [Symbiobacteriaceae bacterium]
MDCRVNQEVGHLAGSYVGLLTTRRVLLVEDDDMVREALGTVLHRAGHFVLPVASAADAMDALSLVPFDMVLSDVVLPHGSGFDVAAHARRVRPGLPVVLMSSFVAEDLVTAPTHAADAFLRKPVMPGQILELITGLTTGVRAEVAKARSIAPPAHSRLYTATDTVRGLLHLISMRDTYTLEHSRRVRRLTNRLARAIGLPDEQVKEISLAAWVHDVGKIAVPGSVLHKTGPLTPDEMVLMRGHAVAGAAILASLGMPPQIVNTVRHHHERYDGDRTCRYHGYPAGLAGDEIPLSARILTVVDAFDAMTTPRCYRTPVSVKDALREVQDLAGMHFDPNVARVFLEMMSV